MAVEGALKAAGGDGQDIFLRRNTQSCFGNQHDTPFFLFWAETWPSNEDPRARHFQDSFLPTGVYFMGVPTSPMRYWLLKSEPDVFSFDDLKKRPKKTEPWNGVRNYQVRNMMRDEMATGDLGFFYHSSCPVPGIAGVVKIVKEAYPDSTQFDPSSEYFDQGSKPESPRWLMVDVKWEAEFKTFVTLDMLRAEPSLADMITLRKGNRLSITPVEKAHWEHVCEMGGLG